MPRADDAGDGGGRALRWRESACRGGGAYIQVAVVVWWRQCACAEGGGGGAVQTLRASQVVTARALPPAGIRVRGWLRRVKMWRYAYCRLKQWSDIMEHGRYCPLTYSKEGGAGGGRGTAVSAPTSAKEQEHLSQNKVIKYCRNVRKQFLSSDLVYPTSSCTSSY